MEKCVFCEIYKKNEKGEIIIKKKDHYVIFDKYPASKGHMLIISNRHYKNIILTPQKTSASILNTARTLGKILLQKLDADGVKITMNNGEAANQVIMHTHVHVIPRYLEHKHKGFEPHKETHYSYNQEIKKKILREIKKM